MKLTLQALGILNKVLVRMLNLKIKFNSLKQNALQRHHFFSWIITKRLILGVRQQTPCNADDIFAFLGSLFNFPGEEQTATRRHVARKVPKQ